MMNRRQFRDKGGAILPYSFVGEGGGRAEVIPAELYGTEEQGGALDYLYELMLIEVKKAFEAGYLRGTLATLRSLPESVSNKFDVSQDLNRQMATRAWERYESENELG